MALLAQVTAEPLSLEEHLRAVASPDAGAVATFVGQVRDHDHEATGEVVSLEYSAHPDAARILTEIASRFAAQFAADGVRVAVSHRVGVLAVGDYALVACVSSAHRAAAFDACRDLVEAVKVELPVWKRQSTDDGTHGWVGLT
ncbi:molybdopterin synthase catalytic subunit [Sanguibacter gelidistatuariae]|uniref:Molybdopterin synthase catalytic subunit n=1 Tax=Sanguibacter gelidistatuariae TaxID=1814289 RepID=A0A1G6GQ34_9MICO|nr:molybdenum cofactor biosynthesis protein MoaE [Sanguibacter gelidistatuariae]SDB84077.1 molybdopterin synthase catalytic subunit [Sanguibacter gelidistatuariae]